MPLVQLERVTLEYGEQVLLRDAELCLQEGERVCLLGRNGAGKTSSFKLISGEIEPDRGRIERQPGLKVAELPQRLPAALESSVEEFVAGGLEQLLGLRREYERLSTTDTLDAAGLNRLERLQAELDADGGWTLEQRVEAVMSELGLPAGKRLHELSAGWQRRVALARALVCAPDLLLLDEPTNHLDFSTVEWLEHHVRGFSGCVLFVSHDRRFVSRVATRIVELDRGRLTSWPGNYARFVRERDKALAKDNIRNALFDKRLAEEEAWIREGVKARRSRNQGRVKTLLEMREQRRRRLALEAGARISIDTAEPSGRKVVELKNVAHGFGDRVLFSGLSLRLMRGDRLGLVGNNGVGKTTLVRIMLGELAPERGVAKQGTNLEIGYFEPVGADMPLDQTVADFVGQGREYIDIGGKSRHIISYLNGFLFSAGRARTRIRSLSGGERNRVLLARVLTRPANVLVLDEPTNDLDVETLEVLENRLVDFDGTLIVVSHDREFLDNVVTSVLVFEEDGVREYVGGYSDWAARAHKLRALDDPRQRSTTASKAVPAKPRRTPKKLSYKLQRELDRLPDSIEQLEQAVSTLEAQTAEAGFYEQPYPAVQQVLDELKRQQHELEVAMERWAELELLRAELQR